MTEKETRSPFCGHSASSIVQGREGTAYCAECEREAREADNAELSVEFEAGIIREVEARDRRV